MLEWKPLRLDDREIVTDYLRRFPPIVSELTFTNLFVWRRHRPIFLAETDGTLLVAAEHGGQRALLGPPLGGAPVEEMLDGLADSGIQGFDRMPAPVSERLCRAGIRMRADRDNYDYVYLRQDLADLAGRRYHGQKNLVNQCLARHECEYVEITADLLDEVREMQDRWCAERQPVRDATLCAEYGAIHELIKHYGRLGVLGGAIRIGGRIEAYTVGERLAPDTAVIHFEKAMSAFTGLYQVINQWFCRNALGEFEFVNREQDLGLSGLRRAKKSYHPHHMVRKCVGALAGRTVRAETARESGRCCCEEPVEEAAQP